MAKIATVTIPLPVNYGNALQTLALQTYLSRTHTVEVLKHSANGTEGDIYLWYAFCKRSIWHKLIFVISCMTWTGRFCAYVREVRTRRWFLRMIRGSNQMVLHGNSDSVSCPYDTLVVGSDQVWNSGAKDVEFYMLAWAPECVKRISYAASFNSEAFPSERYAFYRKQISRFHAISVREESSIKKLEEKFGVRATLVCDPTLLLNCTEWDSLLGLRGEETPTGYYMFYIVSPQGVDYCDDMIRIARQTKLPVHVYGYDCITIPLKAGRILRTVAQTIRLRWRLWKNGVRLHFAATPTEFVQGLKGCKGLFTDSFHGMMFATIYKKNCVVVVGNNNNRVQMKAKLTDFAKTYGDESVITDRFEVSALRQLSMTPRCLDLIENSKQWLADVIG